MCSIGLTTDYLVDWFELLVLCHASAVCGTITDLPNLWSSTKNTLLRNSTTGYISVPEL